MYRAIGAGDKLSHRLGIFKAAILGRGAPKSSSAGVELGKLTKRPYS